MKKINIDEKLLSASTEKFVKDYIEECIRKKDIVLSEEYLNWLVTFIQREKEFDDEPNRVGYSDVYTDIEKNNIYIISHLYMSIAECYERLGREYSVIKSEFYNQAVTVNLTDDVAIEMRMWCGQGTVINVSLIEPKTGMLDINDVIAFHIQ